MAQKYKKRSDGRYLVQVQKGIKPDGKPDYKNIYGRTIAELEKKEREFRAELDKGIVVDDQGLTVGVWAEKRLETYKVGREYNTTEMYRYAIKNHIKPHLGHFKLKDLKTHHIQEFINMEAAKGLTKTLKVIKSTLGQILNQAVKNEYIYKNVLDNVEFPHYNKPKKRSLTDTEKLLIEKADFDLRSKAFVYMLLYTGLRRGEALALTINDIDMKNKKVVVSKNLIFKGNLPEIHLRNVFSLYAG